MKKFKQAIVFLFPVFILATLAACGAADLADGSGRETVSEPNQGTEAGPSMTNATHRLDSEFTNVGEESTAVQSQDYKVVTEFNPTYKTYDQYAIAELGIHQVNENTATATFGRKPELQLCTTDDCE